MTLCIHQVLPPVPAVGGLPDLSGALRPGLLQQVEPVLQIEKDIGQVINRV